MKILSPRESSTVGYCTTVIQGLIYSKIEHQVQCLNRCIGIVFAITDACVRVSRRIIRTSINTDPQEIFTGFCTNHCNDQANSISHITFSVYSLVSPFGSSSTGLDFLRLVGIRFLDFGFDPYSQLCFLLTCH